MGTIGTLQRAFLGAGFYLAIVGLVGVCIYASIFCSNNNPWLSYQPKHTGLLGDIAYVIAVSSIFSAFFYIGGYVLVILQKINLLKIVFSTIATVIALVCIICEIMFMAWGNWSLEHEVSTSFEDDSEIQNYAQQFLTGIKPAYYDYEYSNRTDLIIFGMPTLGLRSPPTYGRILSKVPDGDSIVTKEIGMPVCVFKTQEDKENFKVEKCIGEWDGDKLKTYMDKLNDKIAEDKEKQNEPDNKKLDDEFQWTQTNLVLYSQIGCYSIISIFFGIQICALIFGLCYFILALSDIYCGCNDDTDDQLAVIAPHP